MGAHAAQGESQQTIAEAADDARAEAEMMNDADKSAGDGGSPAAAGAGPRNLPNGLFQHRLEKERGEKE